MIDVADIDIDDHSDLPESKSQRKRDARDITALAGKLVEMRPKVLAALPLDQQIREAVATCAEIKAHGGRKRQLHYVSKLLRKSDNIEDIQQLVDRPDLKKSSAPGNPHLNFRDQLLEAPGDHVDTLRENYPAVELQQVRQLVRNAHNEHKKLLKDNPESKIVSTKSAKALLRLLGKLS